MTLDAALKPLGPGRRRRKPLGHDPATGKPIFIKTGRFGPYVQLGIPDEEEKPKNASLMKGMTARGHHGRDGVEAVVLAARFGRASADGRKDHGLQRPLWTICEMWRRDAQLAGGPVAADVTFEQAVELLAQPKKQRRGFGAPKEPLKVLGTSPVTKEEVKLLEGRYGPYVADGVTNASLPKQQPIEEATLEQALALLAARAEAGPSDRQSPRPRCAKKKAANRRRGEAGEKEAEEKAAEEDAKAADEA